MREILSMPGKGPGMESRVSLDQVPCQIWGSKHPWSQLVPGPAALGSGHLVPSGYVPCTHWLMECSACLFLLIKQTKRDYCDRLQPGLCVVVESHCLRKYMCGVEVGEGKAGVVHAGKCSLHQAGREDPIKKTRQALISIGDPVLFRRTFYF